jgi:hypothetical protein
MKHTLHVIFGKEQVAKFYNNDESLTDEEISLYTKQYHFNTEAEKLAFIYGLHESNGWQEYCIPESENA